MNRDERSELSWLAVAYLCGELSREDETALEQRFEHDQAAREALAAAVELAGAIARLPADADRGLHAHRGGALPWAARWAAAAAALVLASVALSQLGRSPATNHASVRPGAPSPALALTWSGVHRDEQQTDDLLQWLDTAVATDEIQPPAAGNAEPADVPDWMLAAASLGDVPAADDPSPREH